MVLSHRCRYNQAKVFPPMEGATVRPSMLLLWNGPTSEEKATALTHVEQHVDGGYGGGLDVLWHPFGCHG